MSLINEALVRARAEAGRQGAARADGRDLLDRAQPVRNTRPARLGAIVAALLVVALAVGAGAFVGGARLGVGGARVLPGVAGGATSVEAAAGTGAATGAPERAAAAGAAVDPIPDAVKPMAVAAVAGKGPAEANAAAAQTGPPVSAPPAPGPQAAIPPTTATADRPAAAAVDRAAGTTGDGPLPVHADAEHEARPPAPEPAPPRQVQAPAEPAAPRRPQTFVRSVDQPRLPPLRLDGIVWSAGSPVALVNGSLARTGDEIRGATILDIERKRIRVAFGDVTFFVRLP